MIKCVVTDLDGTLIYNNSISERNKAALQMLAGKGVDIVFATGREADCLQLFSYIQCEALINNGAGYVNAEGDLVFDLPINAFSLKKMISIVENSLLGMILYTDKGMFAVNPHFVERGFDASFSIKTKENRFYRGLNNIDKSLIEQLKVYKTEIMDTEMPREIEKLRNTFKLLPGITITSSMNNNIEVNAIGADKKEALLRLMKIKKLERDEVAAFGDGENDSGMFDVVCETYAVDNAVDEIKKKARYHVPACKDDGLYYGVMDLIRRIENQ